MPAGELHAFQLTDTGDCRCGEALRHETHTPHQCPTPYPGDYVTGDSWRCDCSQIWERTESGWVRSEVLHGLQAGGCRIDMPFNHTYEELISGQSVCKECGRELRSWEYQS